MISDHCEYYVRFGPLYGVPRVIIFRGGNHALPAYLAIARIAHNLHFIRMYVAPSVYHRPSSIHGDPFSLSSHFSCFPWGWQGGSPVPTQQQPQHDIAPCHPSGRAREVEPPLFNLTKYLIVTGARNSLRRYPDT